MINREDKKIISVVGAKSSGVTFTAVTLCLFMAQYEEGVTYFEDKSEKARGGGVFYELSLDKHISSRRFVDFFEMKQKGEATNNRLNLYEGVNWAVRGPNTAVDALLEPGDVAGRYILADTEQATEKSALVLCVVDGLPSKVMAARELVEMCKRDFETRTIWILNRIGSERQRKQIEKFLGISGDYVISFQPQESFYEAQRGGYILGNPSDRKNPLAPHLEPEVEAVFEELAGDILTLY